MLAQRVASILVLGPLVLFLVYLGNGWYLTLVAFAITAGTWELYSLLRRASYAPLWPFGIVLSLVFLLDAYFLPGQIAPPSLALALLLSLSYLVLCQRVDGSLADWAVTWLPPLYVGFLAAHFVSLRILPEGLYWVCLAVGATWATDIAAYVVGSLLGRRRFFPSISPRKSWEGAIGGFAGGVVAGAVLSWLFGWDLLRMLPLIVLIPVAAEAGDLAESLLKRQLRAKDAGQVIPGHGGVLDRLDSLLFVGVVTYYWAVWVGGGI